MTQLKVTMALLLCGALLAGCAGVRVVDSDVATFSQWPAARPAGRYAFERLPSQQARPQEQDRLELLARPALAAVGFVPVAEGQRPEVHVQLGVRASRADRSLAVDPLWWQGGVMMGRYGYRTAWGPSMSWYLESPHYEREVVVLIRDVASGQPLYEARASNEGGTTGDDAFLAAMFRAALMDFPHIGVNPRRVRVPLAP